MAFFWDQSALQYVDQAGVPVSWHDAVRTSLDTVIESQAERMGVLAERLQADAISITEWQVQMEDAVRQMHTAGAAAARGGWEQMSDAEWGWTGPRIKKQYKYLERFGDQLKSGEVKMDGAFVNRCGMYAQAARGSFEEMRREQETLAGRDEEMLVLSDADHCQECPEDADLGWVPIGTLKPIGERACLVNCACSMDFRDAALTTGHAA